MQAERRKPKQRRSLNFIVFSVWICEAEVLRKASITLTLHPLLSFLLHQCSKTKLSHLIREKLKLLERRATKTVASLALIIYIGITSTT